MTVQRYAEDCEIISLHTCADLAQCKAGALVYVKKVLENSGGADNLCAQVCRFKLNIFTLTISLKNCICKTFLVKWDFFLLSPTAVLPSLRFLSLLPAFLSYYTAFKHEWCAMTLVIGLGFSELLLVTYDCHDR